MTPKPSNTDSFPHHEIEEWVGYAISACGYCGKPWPCEYAQGSASKSSRYVKKEPPRKLTRPSLKAEIEEVLVKYRNGITAFDSGKHVKLSEATTALLSLFKEYVEGIIGEDDSVGDPLTDRTLLVNVLRKEQRERLNKLTEGK